MEKKLGFGVMRLPLTDDTDRSTVDMEQAGKMVDLFMERGFTYFDTAWFYHEGKSEEIVKELVTSRYPRDAYTVTSKMPSFMIHSPEDCEKVFTTQLQRTGLEFFDYYFLHNLNSSSRETFENNHCFSYLSEQKATGRIGHIGFSCHDTPEFLEEILTLHPEMEVVQIQLNYLDWDSLGVRSRECLEVCRRHGKPVIVMEPCKGGTLAQLPERGEQVFRKYDPNRSLPSWAIRFAASQPGVKMVLSGMSSMEQVRDNTDYMLDFVPLNEGELKLCAQVAAILNEEIAIPCTGCSYCTLDCPKQIPIPQYFSLYNADRQEMEGKAWSPQENYYENLAKVHSGADACIKCGACEKHCPQNLPIRQYLEVVAERFKD